jgi:Predicted membrane protein
MDQQDFLRAIFDENKELMENQDFLHTLIHEKISANIDDEKCAVSLGAKMSDGLAAVAGSWSFIIVFMIILAFWIILNLNLNKSAFDPYPFILLNLVLSCIAAIQAPIIMMSQNRQEDKDRARSKNDFKVNLKSEFILENLHENLDKLYENQQVILGKLSELEKKLG